MRYNPADFEDIVSGVEEIGGEIEGEIEGDEDEDYVSGDEMKAAARVLKTGAQQRGIPMKLSKSGMALKLLPVGFETVSAALGAGASETVVIQPVRAFRGQRLVFTHNASACTVTATVAGAPVQLTANGIPCDSFKPEAQGIDLEFPECPPNQSINLTITNITAAALATKVRGSLFGTGIGLSPNYTMG